MEENSLWVEKFRPSNLDDYIGNTKLVETVKRYISEQDVPHLLFYGPAGTGKTTLAKIIANKLDSDILYINASDENNVDTVRSKIRGFASTVGFSKWKIIILDEADYLTPNAQAILRNLMEAFSKTTRFILTCNFPQKILDPIQSRCQSWAIVPPNKKEVALRLAAIMKELGVKYDVKDIAKIINIHYPDIRRVINYTQQSVLDGELKLDSDAVLKGGYVDEVLEIMRGAKKANEKWKQIRQTIQNAHVNDFSDLYKELYNEIETYSKSVPNSIVTIAKYQYQDSLVVDKEINIMALVSEILEQ